MIDLRKLIENMTFGEDLLYKKLVGKSKQHIEKSMEDDASLVLAVFYFIAQRRTNPRFTWAEAQEMSMNDIAEEIDLSGFEDTEDVSEEVIDVDGTYSPIDDIDTEIEIDAVPKAPKTSKKKTS